MDSEKAKHSVVKYKEGYKHHVKAVSNKWLSKSKYNFIVSLPNLKGKTYMEEVKADSLPRHCWKKFACTILKSDFGMLLTTITTPETMYLHLKNILETLEEAEEFAITNYCDFLATVLKEITIVKNICNEILGEQGEEEESQVPVEINDSMNKILKKIHSVKERCGQILRKC